LKDFDHVLEIQKKHILECIQEFYLTDETTGENFHYYESLEDGDFKVFRGTNRNESLHKRINVILPERSSEE
jgi:hypothetical protein